MSQHSLLKTILDANIKYKTLQNKVRVINNLLLQSIVNNTKQRQQFLQEKKSYEEELYNLSAAVNEVIVISFRVSSLALLTNLIPQFHDCYTRLFHCRNLDEEKKLNARFSNLYSELIKLESAISISRKIDPLCTIEKVAADLTVTNSLKTLFQKKRQTPPLNKISATTVLGLGKARAKKYQPAFKQFKQAFLKEAGATEENPYLNCVRIIKKIQDNSTAWQLLTLEEKHSMTSAVEMMISKDFDIANIKEKLTLMGVGDIPDEPHFLITFWLFLSYEILNEFLTLQLGCRNFNSFIDCIKQRDNSPSMTRSALTVLIRKDVLDCFLLIDKKVDLFLQEMKRDRMKHNRLKFLDDTKTQCEALQTHLLSQFDNQLYIAQLAFLSTLSEQEIKTLFYLASQRKNSNLTLTLQKNSVHTLSDNPNIKLLLHCDNAMLEYLHKIAADNLATAIISKYTKPLKDEGLSLNIQQRPLEELSTDYLMDLCLLCCSIFIAQRLQKKLQDFISTLNKEHQYTKEAFLKDSNQRINELQSSCEATYYTFMEEEYSNKTQLEKAKKELSDSVALLLSFIENTLSLEQEKKALLILEKKKENIIRIEQVIAIRYSSEKIRLKALHKKKKVMRFNNPVPSNPEKNIDPEKLYEHFVELNEYIKTGLNYLGIHTEGQKLKILQQHRLSSLLGQFHASIASIKTMLNTPSDLHLTLIALKKIAEEQRSSQKDTLENCITIHSVLIQLLVDKAKQLTNRATQCKTTLVAASKDATKKTGTIIKECTQLIFEINTLSRLTEPLARKDPEINALFGIIDELITLTEDAKTEKRVQKSVSVTNVGLKNTGSEVAEAQINEHPRKATPKRNRIVKLKLRDGTVKKLSLPAEKYEKKHQPLLKQASIPHNVENNEDETFENWKTKMTSEIGNITRAILISSPQLLHHTHTRLSKILNSYQAQIATRQSTLQKVEQRLPSSSTEEDIIWCSTTLYLIKKWLTYLTDKLSTQTNHEHELAECEQDLLSSPYYYDEPLLKILTQYLNMAIYVNNLRQQSACQQKNLFKQSTLLFRTMCPDDAQDFTTLPQQAYEVDELLYRITQLEKGIQAVETGKKEIIKQLYQKADKQWVNCIVGRIDPDAGLTQDFHTASVATGFCYFSPTFSTVDGPTVLTQTCSTNLN